MIKSFEEWITAMEEMVERIHEPQDRCVAALELMDRVIAGRDHLDLARFVPGVSSYARHLIHRDPRDRFAMLGLVWKPGQGTPIHDHPSWGVYGVVKNRIRFVNYVLEERESGRNLLLTGATMAYPGSTTTVFPPYCDVHRMENPDASETSMTLHCYGQEVLEFNIYSPGTGECRPGTVTYDSVPG